ncbi:hypothetical protein ACMGDH_03620 [Sphingomonas sp. DT-207]|uniref:hypothetical protein n=1 Tax=Sphingomonas sp. DT-207 TaxID=3396167 RepID=UPI003F1A3507
MDIENPRLPGQADNELIEHMAGLLARYPAVSDEERDTLVAFLTRGPLIERGTLMGRSGMREQFDLLKRSHRREFGMSLQGLLVVLGLIAALIGAGVLLWDFGL